MHLSTCVKSLRSSSSLILHDKQLHTVHIDSLRKIISPEYSGLFFCTNATILTCSQLLHFCQFPTFPSVGYSYCVQQRRGLFSLKDTSTPLMLQGDDSLISKEFTFAFLRTRNLSLPCSQSLDIVPLLDKNTLKFCRKLFVCVARVLLFHDERC